MTIEQLKKAVANLPSDMEVFIGERLTEGTYGLANSASVRKITVDYEDLLEHEERKVFILSEE